MTLFGLFARGTPVALAAGLQSLPDAGIDASFCASIFTALLAGDRASLNAFLTAAVSKNVLPASYSSAQSAQLDLLDTLRQFSPSAAARHP